MGRWNKDRWHQTGTTDAGDPVYERTVTAGDKSVASLELSKAELQAQAEARGLATSGTKAELIERLSGE